MIHVGKILRDLRENAGLSASELANSSGFTRSALSRAERRSVSMLGEKNLLALLSALGLSHDQFLWLVAAGWDRSLTAWKRFHIILAAWMLEPQRLDELHTIASRLVQDAGGELPQELPSQMELRNGMRRRKVPMMLRIKEPPKHRDGGHTEQVVRHYEAMPREMPNKGGEPGISAGSATSKHPKARKRTG